MGGSGLRSESDRAVRDAEARTPLMPYRIALPRMPLSRKRSPKTIAGASSSCDMRGIYKSGPEVMMSRRCLAVSVTMMMLSNRNTM